VSGTERAAIDAETRSVLSDLERLMGDLRASVDALRVIISEPEVPGDEPVSA
jgi:hypothetical protein